MRPQTRLNGGNNLDSPFYMTLSPKPFLRERARLRPADEERSASSCSGLQKLSRFSGDNRCSLPQTGQSFYPCHLYPQKDMQKTTVTYHCGFLLLASSCEDIFQYAKQKRQTTCFHMSALILLFHYAGELDLFCFLQEHHNPASLSIKLSSFFQLLT